MSLQLNQGLTVIALVPDLLWSTKLVAVMVAVPGAMPDTRPLWSTLATEGLLLDQVTAL
jgi:hypothetical protein